MSVTAVLGEQRGDEGKGRFVDMLAESHDIVARFNGGNNAGHTVILPGGKVLKLHLVPSGIAHSGKINIIGNGCLVNPVKLVEEIDQIKSQKIKVDRTNLLLSSSAHLILPSHIQADEMREIGRSGQGSTKAGIAQVASDKYLRTGLRVDSVFDLDNLKYIVSQLLEDQKLSRVQLGMPAINIEKTTKEFLKACKQIQEYVADTVLYLNNYLKKNPNAKILAEGAQAFLLDIDHGMYPYVTSSSTTSGGIATGLGIAPYTIKDVLGVIKATQSHVGGGPFITEIHDLKALQRLHGNMDNIDAEYGTTTGRMRRLGHLDLPGIRRAQIINGTTHIAISKLDWVCRYGEKVPVCEAYEINGKKYDVAPSDLKDVKPIYKNLDCWEDDISDIRKFEDLPTNAKKYIEFIEKKTGLPVKYIGVGPGREQVIVR